MNLLALVIVILFIAVVMALVVRKLLQRYSSSATQHLEQLSQDYLLKQEDLRVRLEEADKRYQEQLAKANKEVDAMKAKAMQEVEATRQRLIAEARKESEQLVQKAVDTRDALRREIEETLEGKAIDRAREFFCQVLPQHVREEAQAVWLDEAMDHGLAEAVKHLDKDEVDQVRVVSAYSLRQDQQQKLTKRLKEIFGDKIQISTSINEHLIAGLTLILGHTVIDSSLRSKLEDISRKAKEATGNG